MKYRLMSIHQWGDVIGKIKVRSTNPMYALRMYRFGFVVLYVLVNDADTAVAIATLYADDIKRDEQQRISATESADHAE